MSCVADRSILERGPCAIDVRALFLSAVDGPKRGSVLDVLDLLDLSLALSKTFSSVRRMLHLRYLTSSYG